METDWKEEYRLLLIKHVEVLEENERIDLLYNKLLSHRVKELLLQKNVAPKNRSVGKVEPA